MVFISNTIVLSYDEDALVLLNFASIETRNRCVAPISILEKSKIHTSKRRAHLSNVSSIVKVCMTYICIHLMAEKIK